VRPITDPYYQRTAADTLNFYQVSQNGSATATYNIPRKITRHSLVLTGTYQVLNQKQGTITQPATTVMNGNFCYNVSFIKSKWSVGLTYNYNRAETFSSTTMYMGPGLTIGRSFVKNQLRFNLANVFNQAYAGTVNTALVLSERASLSYAPKVDKKYGRPSVSLSAVYTDKFKTTVQTSAFREFTGMVSLNYGF
jgi:hypothetical protein